MVAAVGAVLASAAGRGLFPLPLAGHGGLSAGSQVQQAPEPLVLWPGRQTQLFGKRSLPCSYKGHGRPSNENPHRHSWVPNCGACTQVSVHAAAEWLAAIAVQPLARDRHAPRPPAASETVEATDAGKSRGGAPQAEASRICHAALPTLSAASADARDAAVGAGQAVVPMGAGETTAGLGSAGVRGAEAPATRHAGLPAAAAAALGALTAMAATLTAPGPSAMGAGTARQLVAALGVLLERSAATEVLHPDEPAMHGCAMCGSRALGCRRFFARTPCIPTWLQRYLST